MLVSILIPTYGRSRWLVRAVESALAQSYKPIEVIVVDDFSLDDTPAAMAPYAAKGLVTFRRQSRNVGMVQNWGDTLRLARGELVAFLCDDDELEATFVERRVDALRAAPDAVVAFSGYKTQNADGQPTGEVLPDGVPLGELSSGDTFRAALSRRWFIGTTLYRRLEMLDAWQHILEDDLVLDFSLNLQLTARFGMRGIRVDGADAIVTCHDEQNSVARRATVFEQATGLLGRLSRDTRLSRAARRAISREHSNCRVSWARFLAARGDFAGARRILMRAVAASPTSRVAVLQLCEAVMAPAYFRRSAMRTNG